MSARRHAIMPVGGLYVIGRGEWWLPGNYDSEEAARMALRLGVRTLQRLQEAANARSSDGKTGVITVADLERYLRTKKEAKA